MISIVIPTLNVEARLPACLGALVSANVAGLVKEVIVVDAGSHDGTREIADGFGARLIEAAPGRGGQLKAGAAAARSDWLLFLHADTVLEETWTDETTEFMEMKKYHAGVFTLAFAAQGWRPSMVAWGAMMRTRWSRLPFGDQGLLVSRAVYDEIGGYQDMPLFEDVDIIERLHRAKGPHAMHIFKSRAVTSPTRYERDGYLQRVHKNFRLLRRFRAGVSPEKLAKEYQK